ncbi:hypothetical protein E4N78_06680 [Treponema denticola]|nr:hypothetical protein E4N78_06680 [Treponema denticola]
MSAHSFWKKLVIALCAVCSGVQTVFEIGEFAEVKQDWLKMRWEQRKTVITY